MNLLSPIKSKYIRLVPLTHRQLQFYMQSDYSLEKNLEVSIYPRRIPNELLDPLRLIILPNVKSPDKNSFHYTIWVIICNETNRLVGDLCFKGTPNGQGEIEIGYGTYPDFRNRGYMTKALSSIKNRIKKDKLVKSIIAETKKDNHFSIRILEKLDFKKYKETETTYMWRFSFK